MSDRWTRKDDRIGHDGVDRDPSHKPGPVTHAIEGGKPRLNVTAEERAAKLKVKGSLTVAEQKAKSIYLNSILLTDLGTAIEDGKRDAETINTLVKCSGLALNWEREERQAKGSDDDGDELTPEQLQIIAGKK